MAEVFSNERTPEWTGDTRMSQVNADALVARLRNAVKWAGDDKAPAIILAKPDCEILIAALTAAQQPEAEYVRVPVEPTEFTFDAIVSVMQSGNVSFAECEDAAKHMLNARRDVEILRAVCAIFFYPMAPSQKQWDEMRMLAKQAQQGSAAAKESSHE